MTGYGYSEFQNEKIDIAVELKSYNSKYLEFNINLPPFISPIEPLLRNLLAEKIGRGKAELCVKIREIEEDSSILIDKNSAVAGIDVLKQLADIAGSNEKFSILHLLKIEGIIKKVKNKDCDYFWEIIKPVAEETFLRFDSSRVEEGKKTENDISKQIKLISESVKIFDKFSDCMEDDIKRGFREKLEQFKVDNIDESKVYTEIALHLARFTINEEIVRLKTHVESFSKEIMQHEHQIGKKLDFICQEMNREINTIGSKSFRIEVSQAVIDAKDALEKIREQVRNIA
jgi:uncharacterized protein (TIGR00255 family)